MKRCKLAMSTAACGLSALMTSAVAEDATYTLVIENDYVFNQDRDYSNGMQLDYVSPAMKNRSGLSGHLARRFLGADDNTPLRKRVAIGHYLFTPDDTNGPDAPDGQHPYAAYLYGTFGVLAEKGDNRLDSLHIQAGLVGPEAQGEQLQEAVHDIFNDDVASGWDSQLDTELAFSVTYDQARKYELFKVGPLESDFIANAGGSVGTLLTQAHVGANWRMGFDLSDDFGPVKLYPYVSAGQWDNQNLGSGYVFLGATGRAVARNIFLDGNTFTDSQSVDKEFLVGDWHAGAVVQVGVGQVSFTYQERGKSYETQEVPHKVASMNFSLGL